MLQFGEWLLKMVVAVIALLCLFASASSQQARVVFNQGGVTGWIAFNQSANGSLVIYTRISSELPLGGWHVHDFPVDYTTDPSGRCGATGGHYDPSNRFGMSSNYSASCNVNTPLGCEAGDLSGKFGSLVTSGNMSYVSTDDELQLQGRYGIIGRSIVIHDPDGSRLACGNIVIDNDSPNIYVVTFVSPIAGSIYFRQSSSLGTFVYSSGLYYVNGQSTPTRNHEWHIHVNNPGFRYVTGNCSSAGPHYNPENINMMADDYMTICNPANINNCGVGDLSNKLGLLEIASDPSSVTQHAWTDGNLHMYDIAGRTVAIHMENRGQPIIACAPLVPLAPIRATAYRPPDNSLFTLGQRSPYDATMVTSTVDITSNTYQVTRDGNVRASGNSDCYSSMVFSPFPFDTPNATTEDSFAVGDINGKYTASMATGMMFNSYLFPLFNRYSTLGHNLRVDESGTPTCGTLNPNSHVIQAWVNFTSPMMNGWITFRQLLTAQNNGSYTTGPTLVNYRFHYAMDGMAQTNGHNWHVHRERTGVDGPTRSCEVVLGHYNPYNVDLASNYATVCNSSATNYYPLRCEAGDLSGKHGRLSVRARATGTGERTLVFYDPNLPLVGPYTILGRSIAVHSPEGPIMACSNIEPAVLSTMELQMRFPNLPADTMDPKVAIPVAIVDMLGNSNLMYGEVLVYDVAVSALRVGNVNCTVVTLRFTEFTSGGNPDDTARLVSRLDQNRLPEQYRVGVCSTTGGASVIKPFSILTVFVVVVFALTNTI